MFFELTNLSRTGDLDLAVIESFSAGNDHLLVGWKPHPLVGGGGRGVFTTYLSCLVPKNTTDTLITSIKTHPDYPYKIAQALYPRGFIPTATPDEIRSILRASNSGLSDGEIDAKVMGIIDLTRMKRKAPQGQLWFADLRRVAEWSHNAVSDLGNIIRLNRS